MGADGVVLILLLLVLSFFIGLSFGYFMSKRDDASYKAYMEDRHAIKKATLNEAKSYIRQMTVYELERWLNEKL